MKLTTNMKLLIGCPLQYLDLEVSKCSTAVKTIVFKFYCIYLHNDLSWKCYCIGTLKTLHSCHNRCITLFFDFWETICKMVGPMLSDRCLSVLSCLWCWCTVAKRLDGSRWNLACRQASAWPHCVRWGPSSHSPKGSGAPNFRPIYVVAKWLYGSRCHLVGR